MELICLDLEGVLVPEIWIAVSKTTGIEELSLTTRDVPDYDELMRYRIDILEKRGIDLTDVQSVIEGLEPLPGGAEFLKALRERFQVIILSDTFEQFASPLMAKLSRPTLFCNTLVVTDDRIRGYELRLQDAKKKSVEAFGSIGYRVCAIGDSYNDLGMIDVADLGVLFNAPEKIVAERSDLRSVTTYDECTRAITAWAERKDDR